MMTIFWLVVTLCGAPWFLRTAAATAQRSAAVVTGLDALIAENFSSLQGKTIGIITNHTGVDSRGRHIVDVLLKASNVHVAAVFGPEHGVRGQSEGGETIASQTDSSIHVPVYSLYGTTRKPTPEMLYGLQALVFDMQDVGTRFYTYISTMALAMEAAAEADIEFYVLDRPNPIGASVEGPVLEEAQRSFVGIHPLALRHGMTVGELASMFMGEGWIFPAQGAAPPGAQAQPHWDKLRIMRMHNWHHQMFFPETGLTWVAPSPNMISPQTALLYPGVGLLEATNVSEGRGTPRPFENIGAPWLKPAALLFALQKYAEGLAIDSVRFTPVDLPGVAMNPKFENQECRGLRFTVVEPRRFVAVRFGIALLCALQKNHPQEFVLNERGLARLSGVSWLRDIIIAGESPVAIWNKIETDSADFRQLRRKYLMYED